VVVLVDRDDCQDSALRGDRGFDRDLMPDGRPKSNVWKNSWGPDRANGAILVE
jgi:hypothetical protein